MRFFRAWLILFASKFVILGAINFGFGDEVMFPGPAHGVVAFIVVVMVMLLAEELVARLCAGWLITSLPSILNWEKAYL